MGYDRLTTGRLGVFGSRACSGGRRGAGGQARTARFGNSTPGEITEPPLTAVIGSSKHLERGHVVTQAISPERERLLKSVEAIAPTLRDCVQESERERRLSTAAVEAMRDADLFRCAAVRQVGGLELDPVAQVEVFAAVAAVDAACGWNLMIGAISTAIVSARLGDDAADRVFGSARWPIAAGLVWPRGRATIENGGLRLTGRWQFGSGIHQADWVLGGCVVLDGGKPRTGPDGNPTLNLGVMPQSDVTIHDTWFTAGLRGTGSCDYSADAVFVPEGFWFQGLTPARRGGPWARLPGPVVSATGHSGFALGVARGLLRELETTVGSSKRSSAQAGTSDRESFQIGLGRHTIAYEAARALAVETHRAVWQTAVAGRDPGPELIARMRLSGVHATEVAVEVAQFAFRMAGAAALYEASPIQRALRDILAAQQHVYVSDLSYATFAQERLKKAASAMASGAGAV
jgi:alkylation response protein AidB-like acyl-CoA dehydrogenase